MSVYNLRSTFLSGIYVAGKAQYSAKYTLYLTKYNLPKMPKMFTDDDFNFAWRGNKDPYCMSMCSELYIIIDIDMIRNI